MYEIDSKRVRAAILNFIHVYFHHVTENHVSISLFSKTSNFSMILLSNANRKILSEINNVTDNICLILNIIPTEKF